MRTSFIWTMTQRHWVIGTRNFED